MEGVLLGLILAGFAAGLMDAAVGGGGLLQIPALFGLLPSSTPVPSVLGVNKFASFSGTAMAAGQFVRRVRVPWRMLLPAGGGGVCGFVFGGEAVVAGACAIYEACDVGGDAGDAGVHVLQERFGADGARCGINAARVCHRLGNGGGDWFV